MQKAEWVDSSLQLATRDDASAIRRASADWLDAEHEQDLGGLLRLVTNDVVFLRPNAPALEGRQAVEDLYRTVWASFRIRHAIRFREIRVQGDWAWTWSDEEINLTPVADGAAFRLKGNGMSILRRAADGSWKFARAISNILPGRTP
jgi:uncharacterized protein (TIGR02246 family)